MDAVQEMKGTFMVGLSLYRLDRHHDAIAMFERYLDLSRALNDKSAEATAMTHLGNAHLQLGEVHKSIHLQQQALQLLASVGPVH
jgi:tetratricopeptide (TPR) repeat protein